MPTITTIMVPGMTCGHCVSAVTKELEAIENVEDVSVELRKGAESEVTIVSDNPLDQAALTEAVDEAGYDVTSIDVQENAVAAQSAEQAATRNAAK